MFWLESSSNATMWARHGYFAYFIFLIWDSYFKSLSTSIAIPFHDRFEPDQVTGFFHVLAMIADQLSVAHPVRIVSRHHCLSLAGWTLDKKFCHVGVSNGG